MIELYHNDMSVCAQKVRLALEEIGGDWKSHHLKLRGTEQFTPQYLAINPKGQVPSLIDGKTVVVESTVINEHLADRFGDSGLIPDTVQERTQMRWWTRHLDDDVHDATAVLSASISFLHQYLENSEEKLDEILRTIPEERRRELKKTAFGKGLNNPELPKAARRMNKLLGDMDAQLQNFDWLAGASYSLADVGMTPYVLRMNHLQLDMMFDGRNHLLEWFEKVSARDNYAPAIAKWLNQSYLDLMDKCAREARPRIAEMIAAG